jgi:hypothetical protein
MQSACAVLYCHLLHTWFYNNFCYHLKKRQEFRQKTIESEMCVLIFSSEMSEIYFILIRNQRDFTLHVRCQHVTYPLP